MPKPLNDPYVAVVLPSLLSYDAESGELYWLRREGDSRSVKIFNGRSAGKRAGASAVGDRYRRIGMNINGRKYLMLEHRIAWLLHHGKWPDHDIDHINHNGLDNRIENLRDVVKKDNSRNMSISSRNKSGAIGVCWIEPMHGWRASVGSKVIGYYSTVELASSAAQSARNESGYHTNHGSSK